MATFTTSTGYTLKIKKASPGIFQQLRLAYNIDRPSFKRRYLPPDSTTPLEFDYELPETEPLPDDKEEYALYHSYLSWKREFDEDKRRYFLARNDLMLGTCIKVVKGPAGWGKHFRTGAWVEVLQHSGIEVNKATKRILFLKLEVLSDTTDYIKVLDLATVEETTLEDVLRAFDYFRTILARCPAFQDIPQLAEWRDQFFNSLSGKQGGYTT